MLDKQSWVYMPLGRDQKILTIMGTSSETSLKAYSFLEYSVLSEKVSSP